MRGNGLGRWMMIWLVAGCSVGNKPGDGHEVPLDAQVVDGKPDAAIPPDAVPQGSVSPPGVRNVAGSVRAHSKHYALFAITSAGGSTTLSRNQP